MATKLTEADLRRLAPPTDAPRGYDIHLDTVVRGFGLRITRANVRSWVLTYRNRVGREHRHTIGRFDDWPLAAARAEAKRLKRLIDAGGDPIEEGAADRAAPTVNDLADRFLTDHAPRLRPSSARDAKSYLNRWIRPELGSSKVADVRHADVDRLHRKITAYGTPYQANRVVATLSKMFSLAVTWELRTDNPVRGVERNQEPRRERFLTGAEIERLGAALDVHPDRPAAGAIRLLLLTGARRGEVLAATWDQFDLDAGIWTKPAATTKQKKLHRVPLSAPALALLRELAAERGGRPYVFPAAGGGSRGDFKHAWEWVRRRASIPDVRLHDLRHSFASMLASSGQSLPVIGALLGHTQAATTHRYSHLLDHPLRAATERVGAIVGAGGAKR